MASFTGKKVGAVGYGMMNLTWRGEPLPDEQAFATLKAALNAGATLWNGGEFYGPPHANSLQLLNRYFTKYPEDAGKVVLSIKGGLDLSKFKIDGSKENVTKCINECLKVLDGKKFLNMWEIGRQDANVPLEETVNAVAAFVKSGQIGGLGLSEVTAEQIRNNAALLRVEAVEVEVSLLAHEIFENGVATTCAELGIPIVAYSPLGRGLLLGQMSKPSDLDAKDPRHMLPRFAPGNMEKNAEVAVEFQKLAEAKGCTPAQLSIAWVRHQSGRNGAPIIIPIPGGTTDKRVIENSTLINLTAEEFENLEQLRIKTQVHGSRY